MSYNFLPDDILIKKNTDASPINDMNSYNFLPDDILIPRNTVNDNLSKINNGIQNQETRIGFTGAEVPAPEKKPNFLLRVLDILDRPRNAVFGGINALQTGEDVGEDMLRGLTGKERYTGADVLDKYGIDNKWVKGIGGFGLEVLGDPLTYATLGIGSLGKGLITRAGASLAEESAARLAGTRTLESVNNATRSVLEELGARGDKKLGAQLLAEQGKIAENSDRAFNNYVKKQVYGEELVKNATNEVDQKIADATDRLYQKYGATDNMDLAKKLGFTEKMTEEQAGRVVNSIIHDEAGVGRNLNVLNPAEGLTDKEITRMWTRAKKYGVTSEDIAMNTAKQQFIKSVTPDIMAEYSANTGKGISIFGKDIVKGSTMQDLGAKIGTAMYDSVDKIPVIGKTLKGMMDIGTDSVSRLFNPAYITGLDASDRMVFREILNKSVGMRNSANQQTVDRAMELINSLDPETFKDVDQLIPQVIEAVKDPEALKQFGESATEMFNSMTKRFEEIGFEEKELGVLKEMITGNYFPHVKSWDADTIGNKIKLRTSANWNPQTMHNFERKLSEKLPEANAIMKEKTGVDNFFETSAIKALVSRELEHNRILADKAFVDNIKEAFGEVVHGGNIQELVDKGYAIITPRTELKLYMVDPDQMHDLASVEHMLDKNNKVVDNVNNFVKTAKGTLRKVDNKIDSSVNKFNQAVDKGTNKYVDIAMKSGDKVVGQIDEATSKVLNKSIKFSDTLDNLSNRVTQSFSKISEPQINELANGVINKVESLKNRLSSIQDNVGKRVLINSKHTERMEKAFDKAQDYVETAMEKFVNNIEAKGTQNYEQMVKNIQNFSNSINKIENSISKNMEGFIDNTGDIAEKFQNKLLDSVDSTVGKMNGTKIERPSSTQISEDLQKQVDDMGKLGGVSDKIADKGLDAYNRLLQDAHLLKEMNPNDAKALLGKQYGVNMFAIPRGMVDKVNEAMGRQLNEGKNLFIDIIQRFNRMWIPSVTGLRPGYQLNNEIGGEFNNFLAVGFKMLDPNIQSAGAKFSLPIKAGEKIVLNGKEWALKDVEDAMYKTGALNTFFNGSVKESVQNAMDSVESGMAKKVGETLKHPLHTANQIGRNLSQMVERRNRSILFMSALDKGMTAEQAGELVAKYQFNYADLTKWEQELKTFMPFYTFMRKSLPLMTEELLNDPKLFMAIGNKLPANAQEALGGDTSNLPDWVQQNLEIPLGQGSDGRTTMLNIPTPMQNLNQFANAPGKSILGMINPLVKAPVEIQQNRNFFLGSPIEQYPGQTAQNIISGNGYPGFVSDILQKSPILQDLVRSNPDTVNAIAYLANQFGAVRDMNRFATDSSGTSKSGAIIGSKDISHTDSAFINYLENALADPGMLSYYSPEKGAEQAGYARGRQLGNVINALEGMGVKVPTMSEITDEAIPDSMTQIKNKMLKANGITKKPTAKQMLNKQRVEQYIEENTRLNQLQNSLSGYGIEY